MTWGPRLDFLLEMQEDGEDVPALRSRPLLNQRQMWYMEVFEDLGGSRNAAMGGPLPIPVSEIHSYCQLMDLRGTEFRQTLLIYMRSLDRRYLEVWKRQHADKPPKGK